MGPWEQQKLRCLQTSGPTETFPALTVTVLFVGGLIFPWSLVHDLHISMIFSLQPSWEAQSMVTFLPSCSA